jgi:hypothetical protein
MSLISKGSLPLQSNGCVSGNASRPWTSEHDACIVFAKEAITLRALTDWHTMDGRCDNSKLGGAFCPRENMNVE